MDPVHDDHQGGCCGLGDYRLVLDLHSRWPGRELARGAFIAGVAAFNLGKYGQAIRIWERVRDPTGSALCRGTS